MVSATGNGFLNQKSELVSLDTCLLQFSIIFWKRTSSASAANIIRLWCNHTYFRCFHDPRYIYQSAFYARLPFPQMQKPISGSRSPERFPCSLNPPIPLFLNLFQRGILQCPRDVSSPGILNFKFHDYGSVPSVLRNITTSYLPKPSPDWRW